MVVEVNDRGIQLVITSFYALRRGTFGGVCWIGTHTCVGDVVKAVLLVKHQVSALVTVYVVDVENPIFRRNKQSQLLLNAIKLKA